MTEHCSTECTPTITAANEQQRARQWLFKETDQDNELLIHFFTLCILLCWKINKNRLTTVKNTT
jgi:hypothetical protein